MAAPTKSLDNALGEIAALAKIPQDLRPHFRNRVRDTVNAAVPGIKKMRLSDESITSQLKAVTRQARGLMASLRKIDVPEAAGLRLRAATMLRGVTVKHFIGELELLIEAAEAAASDIARFKRSAGRPGGTPGNQGFDLFVQQLLMNARAAGGKLTIFKSPSANSGWGGSLLKTIKLLRAHLPDDFVPKGLERRLYRIVH
jgi:hypothetical protein